jgi:glycosyltransferase involved in cell wall biosynthesis
MKILIVDTNYFGSDGISSVIKNIITNFEYKDDIIDLVLINQPPNQIYNCVKPHGGQVFVFERQYSQLIKYFISLMKLIKSNKYDILHVHGNSNTMAVEMIASMFAGCKIRIAHSHNTKCRSLFLNYLLSPLFNVSYTFGLACGDAAGKWLFKKKKFTVLKNGINLNRYAFRQDNRDSIRDSLGIDKDTVIVGHVGGFVEQKNHLFILQLIKKLNCYNRKIIFLLVGDGYLKPVIEASVENCGCGDKVVFTGVISNVNEYLSAMDCLILPSLYEGLPLTLIEAQANGLPCYVSSSITREVNYCNNIEFLSISNISEWVLKITSVNYAIDRDKNSIINQGLLRKLNLDIGQQAKELKDIYLNLKSKYPQ